MNTLEGNPVQLGREVRGRKDRDRRSEVGGRGSEITPVEFPWGNPIQLGKEVGSHPGEISCAVTSSISLGKEIRDLRFRHTRDIILG